MSITIAEWEKHFKTLTHERRAELQKAIQTLESDDVFNAQFGWTGLFTLSFYFNCVDPGLYREWVIAEEEKSAKRRLHI